MPRGHLRVVRDEHQRREHAGVPVQDREDLLERAEARAAAAHVRRARPRRGHGELLRAVQVHRAVPSGEGRRAQEGGGELPKQGKKNILVICPGFSSDCVETLEEISIQGKESFLKSGGKNFDVVPCLNDNDDHINLLEKLIKRVL